MRRPKPHDSTRIAFRAPVMHERREMPASARCESIARGRDNPTDLAPFWSSNEFFRAVDWVEGDMCDAPNGMPYSMLALAVKSGSPWSKYTQHGPRTSDTHTTRTMPTRAHAKCKAHMRMPHAQARESQ